MPLRHRAGKQEGEVEKQGARQMEAVTVLSRTPGGTPVPHIPCGTALRPSGHGCYLTESSTLAEESFRLGATSRFLYSEYDTLQVIYSRGSPEDMWVPDHEGP